jgi:hypothetical protein
MEMVTANAVGKPLGKAPPGFGIVKLLETYASDRTRDPGSALYLTGRR